MSFESNINFVNNLYKFYEDFANGNNFFYHKGENYDYVFSNIFHWPRYIYNLNSSDEKTGVITKALLEEIKIKKIPPFLILDPEKMSSVFKQKIELGGMRLIDEWPVMYIKMSGDLSLHWDYKDFKVSIIQNPKQLDEWFKLVSSILFPNKLISYDYFVEKIWDLRYRLLIGLWQDIPVSCALLYMDNLIAGIYMVGTLENYQRRGFGKVITLECLKEAINAGCRYSTLQSSKVGFPLYSKIGFTTIKSLHVYWMVGKEFI